jgi:serine O-acetyltransferase
VTLGSLSTRGGQALKNKKRHPTIEDNVTIYSGASILGGDTVIGKNVVIGGNAFVTHSIPEGVKVSINSQELRYDYRTAKVIKTYDDTADEKWFYII